MGNTDACTLFLVFINDLGNKVIPEINGKRRTGRDVIIPPPLLKNSAKKRKSILTMRKCRNIIKLR